MTKDNKTIEQHSCSELALDFDRNMHGRQRTKSSRRKHLTTSKTLLFGFIYLESKVSICLEEINSYINGNGGMFLDTM
jgi:hypothetical protein